MTCHNCRIEMVKAGFYVNCSNHCLVWYGLESYHETQGQFAKSSIAATRWDLLILQSAISEALRPSLPGPCMETGGRAQQSGSDGRLFAPSPNPSGQPSQLAGKPFSRAPGGSLPDRPLKSGRGREERPKYAPRKVRCRSQRSALS
jgi:hypothetical protein